MKSGDISAIVGRFRPALWPFIWAHALAGFIAAHGKEALGLDAESWLQGLVAGGHWAVLLGGSAAALTAVFNGECGLQAAERGASNAEPDSQLSVPTPRSALRTPHLVFWAALALLLIGLGTSPVLAWWYFDAYLIGVILVAAYAAPPLQLSGLRIGGIAAQAFGFGALTFYSGYAASNDPAFRAEFSPLYLIGFILLFVALRLALKPPSAKWAFCLYWLFLAGAFGCLAAAEIRLGNRFGTALLIVPLAGWCVPGARGDRAQAEEPPLSLAAGLGLCLATDAAVALTSLLR
ncbi:MAG: hypothetical protein ABSA67_08870 [Candidatus Brocadiia bacterium]